MDRQSNRRIPVRRRLYAAILFTTFTVLAIAILSSMFYMLRIRQQAEHVLSKELQSSLSKEVIQKASETDKILDSYKTEIEVLRDYINNMYHERDELIDTGKFVKAPQPDTKKDEYAIQSTYTREDADPQDYLDDLYFFSHLESIFEPFAKDNSDEVSTVYIGTRDGLMVAYDKYSYMVADPDGKNYIYDYTKSEWYKKGIKADGVITTDIYVDVVGRGLTITVAAPFSDLNGNTVGVVAADFDITGLYNRMLSMDLGKGSSSFAIDSKNRVISIDSDKEISAAEFTHLSESDADLFTSGGSGVIERNDAFYAFTPVKNAGWALCAMVPRTVLLESVETIDNSFRSAMLLFILTAVFLVIAGLFISGRVTRYITHPIDLLMEDMNQIASGDLDHKARVYRNDEFGDMATGLNDMVSRLKATMHDLVNANNRADLMHELANKDALTGVRNRTAYDKHLQMLDDGIKKGETGFGIAMIDLNDLKHINDNYGHEKGNIALKTLCSVICDVFDHSPVFRIGGDEFAVVLYGSSYDNYLTLISEFNRRIEQRSVDASLEPCERVSAAIGCAIFDSSIDRGADDVFVRADSAMYEHKTAMKAGRQ